MPGQVGAPPLEQQGMALSVALPASIAQAWLSVLAQTLLSTAQVGYWLAHFPFFASFCGRVTAHCRMTMVYANASIVLFKGLSRCSPETAPCMGPESAPCTPMQGATPLARTLLPPPLCASHSALCRSVLSFCRMDDDSKMGREVVRTKGGKQKGF